MDKNIIARLALFDDTLLTKDVANLLGMHPETVRRMIYSGELHCIRYGKDYIIAKQWLRDYLDNHELDASYQEQFDQIIEGVLGFCTVPRTSHEILAFTGYCNKSHLQKMITRPLLQAGKLRLTIPESPHHNGQKYLTV